jgi:hypothetical protein
MTSWYHTDTISPSVTLYTASADCVLSPDVPRQVTRSGTVTKAPADMIDSIRDRAVGIDRKYRVIDARNASLPAASTVTEREDGQHGDRQPDHQDGGGEDRIAPATPRL